MNSDTPTIIYSAYKLDEEEINRIVEKFPFIKVDLINNIIDEKILAGVRIHHGAKIIDLSLKNKLTNLKKKLYETS